VDFTARQVRLGIRNPGTAAREISRQLGAGPDESIRRSPQRPTFEAALRRYFAAGRNPAVLLADYDRRWERAKRRESAASAFREGRRMAAYFAEQDQMGSAPLRALDPATRRDIGGHALRMGHDLVYRSDEGLVLRQLLTDSDVTRIEHLRLYATACLLHFEASGKELARLEIWQLRFRGVMGWPRWLLTRQVPALRNRLDEVARRLTEDAA
jgi:hypothetical protein